MDVEIAWNSTHLRGDWIIKNGGFAIDAGLRTAVLVSLFTNKRAPADWTPPAGNPASRGGFWGDTYRKRPLGSWLWLLWRIGIGNEAEVLAKGQYYCQDALAWLIEDGIADSITIETGWVVPGTMGIEGTITRPKGLTLPFNYPWLWIGA